MLRGLILAARFADHVAVIDGRVAAFTPPHDAFTEYLLDAVACSHGSSTAPSVVPPGVREPEQPAEPLQVS